MIGQLNEFISSVHKSLDSTSFLFQLLKVNNSLNGISSKFSMTFLLMCLYNTQMSLFVCFSLISRVCTGDILICLWIIRLVGHWVK